MLPLRAHTCVVPPLARRAASGRGSEHKGEEDTALDIKGPGILVAKATPNSRSVYLFKEKATRFSSLVEEPSSAVGLAALCWSGASFLCVSINAPTILQVMDCL